METIQSKYEGVSSSKNQNNGVKITTLATNSEGGVTYERKCSCCSGTCTDLASCDKFKAIGIDERNKTVQNLHLCFNCLKGKHMSKDCRKPQVCTVSDCTVKHHSLLHRWVTEKDCIATQPSVSCAATNTAFSKGCLGIIPVVVKGSDGNTCRTYALLDDGADKTLCDERLLKSLNISSRPVTFRMSTVSSTGSTIYGQEVDLDVQPLNGNDAVSLRNVWSVKRLPISTKSAAVNSDI